ncbi:MAG: M20/M25/M40 family metallo-hydrolase [Gemmatimonadetes bacterium]|nr:M20/M25/M40 family metallo-hydrolase [Gemmatimonadota bacterium]
MKAMRRSAALLATFATLACGEPPGIGPEEPVAAPPPDPIVWLPDVGALLARAERSRFMADIEALAAFGDRTQGAPSNIAAAAWIEQRLVSLGYEVERHPYLYRGAARESLYATKVGATEPDKMYLVSAHMDGRGGGGAADDDASGVALVLEVARVLALVDVSTERSVRFALWNNEETGLNGSTAYVSDRAALQGIEDPPSSGRYPEPTWLGIIQHDMILFDHGLPPGPQQSVNADVDVEYQSASAFALESQTLADVLRQGNREFGVRYPARVGSNMRNTDSWPFRDLVASVSVRENQRVAEIGAGSNPHWHQPTDLFSTYDDADFDLGFAALRTTLSAVAQLSGARIVP